MNSLSLTSKTKPFSHILFSLSSQALHFSLFTTSSSSSSSSSQSLSSSSHHTSRRHEEESRNVKVSVWWDIENCGVPTGVNAFRVAQSITAAVRVNGIKGPIQISAFGDVVYISRPNQEALSSTGINLIHVPHGGRNSADRSLLVDLMYWVSQNPPPAHIFLISSDRDFAGILHRLRMNNYNVLLAGKDGNNTPSVLCSAASIMWHWNELVKGENLSGMHFNQPPDGPFNSWYGHYRGPIEDPYEMLVDQQSCAKANHSSNAELLSDKKHEIPRAVLNQIRRVINSYPHGLSISELREQLSRRKITIDKKFYGHKKFSQLLLSMPHIVKAVSLSDGRYLLRPVSRKVSEPVESDDISVGSMMEGRNQDVQATTNANCEAHSINRVVDPKAPLPVSSSDDMTEQKVEEKVKETPEKDLDVPSRKKVKETSTKKVLDAPLREKVQETPEKVLDAPLQEKVKETPEKVLDAPLREDQVVSTYEFRGEEPLDAQVVKSPVAPTEEQNSKCEMGIIKRMWMKWFSSSLSTEKTSLDIRIPDKVHTSSGTPEKLISDEGPTIPTNQHEICGPSHSSPSSTSKMESQSDAFDQTEVSTGFFRKVLSWFKPRRDESSAVTLTEQSSEEPSSIEDSRKHEDAPALRKHEIAAQSQEHENASQSRKHEIVAQSRKHDDSPQSSKHELFLKDTFWSTIESFFRTSRGLNMVFNSPSREQFARRLKSDGPLVLRSLQESEILQLIDLLVSEKKWIKEFPTKSPRFGLDIPLGKRSDSAHTRNSSGLSSIFLSSSQENPHIGVTSAVHKKQPEKSRSEVLRDCQMLLDELLVQYPEGFNLGLLKIQFIEKYGYALDYKKLGYSKLVSLLQIMPGVKVEHCQVLPDSVVYAPGIGSLGSKETSASSDSEMSDSPRKDEDAESPWEELGPVANSDLRKQDKGFGLCKVNSEYQPSVSEDDEFSDSEDESLTHNEAEDQSRSRVNEEDSSLLQILNSWYSTNDESNPRDHASDFDGLVDCSKEKAMPSGSSPVGPKSEVSSTVNLGQKQRQKKSYTFVVDSLESNKDKLIDGILGSLKKSGESRMQG